MSDQWTQKLDLYLDGELAPAEMKDLYTHLRTCPDCTAEVLHRVQFKRALHSAGKRYSPSAEFRERITSIASARRPSSLRVYLAAAGVALAGLLVIAAFLIGLRVSSGNYGMAGEIADLHVVTLASANPLDVVSSDRHTVKPWFQGKIPFSFNLPELQDSEFTLLGGRVTYLEQAPGAELIYQIRKHQISVFVFNARQVGGGRTSDHGPARMLSFNFESWEQDGLRYFVIGDASGADIRNLAELFKNAGRM
jgi:anti-sigma factor RsiW